MDIENEFYIIYESIIKYLDSVGIYVTSISHEKYEKRIYTNDDIIFYVIIHNNTILIQLNKYLHYKISEDETGTINGLYLNINQNTYIENNDIILNFIFCDITRHYKYIVDSNVTYENYMSDNKKFISEFNGNILQVVRNKKLKELNKIFENGC